MTQFDNAADRAVENLPQGWLIDVKLVAGSSSVELFEPDGDLFWSDEGEQSIDGAVCEAVAVACEFAKQHNRQPDPRKFG